MSGGISELRVQNYGCIKDLELTGLGPIQAFVGPNDSGKSTILRAIRTCCFAASHKWKTADEPFAHGLEPSSELRIAGDRFVVEFEVSEVGSLRGKSEWRDFGLPIEGWVPTQDSRHLAAMPAEKLGNFVAEPLMLRLDADRLKQPSELIEDGKSIGFDNERGAGLAGVYDAIRNRGDDAFSRISDSIRKLFPTVRYVGLRNSSSGTKELQLELTDGTKVPASALSEGLVLYLAFAALPYLGQPPVVLVEEPENGLHPARIKDVVRVLREVSKHSQVFLATHSPLLVNELEPHEVYVTTRHPTEGTTVTRLDETENFAERSSVYQNGELWIAYADGEDESALVGSNS